MKISWGNEEWRLILKKVRDSIVKFNMSTLTGTWLKVNSNKRFGAN